MANGLQPPLSAWYNNHNRNSDGAFIRSEIWACLMPGHPDLAAEYAYSDASVDHFGEGVYGEIFTAAIESAAFAESDKDKLIDIGLSYIPSGSDTAKAVNLVRKCYKSNLNWKEARKKLLQEIPCAFGTIWENKAAIPEPDIPAGSPGYDLPANIGLFVLGWLYGENDFGKSICIAAGCCEDGDCTAATLGAVLGIINGAESLPSKWTEPIDDDIKTISLNIAMNSLNVPLTVTELTERVCNVMPVFLCGFYNPADSNIKMTKTNDMYCRDKYRATFVPENFKDRFKSGVPELTYENMFLKVLLRCPDGINAVNDEPINFEMEVFNLIPCQQWLTVKVFSPKHWECSAGSEFTINLDQPHSGYGNEIVKFQIIPHEILSAKNDVIFEISSASKLSRIYIPLTLLCAPQQFRKILNKL